MAIVDTFNRADSATTLGTTSDGTATWTAAAGTWGISSNQAYAPSGTTAVAYVDAATADTSASVLIAAVGLDAGLAFRITDGSNFWIIIGNTTPANQGLWKSVAGAFTQVSAFTVAVGSTVSVVTSGTSITAKVNGVVRATPTDNFNSTATKFGLFAGNTGDRLDNFSIPENIPAAPAYHSPYIRVARQAVRRASVI